MNDLPVPKGALDWGGLHEMSELEATMWRANRHPENSTQGGVLELLGATPDWNEFRRWHEYGLSQFPRFMQKVVEPALPVGPPVWVDDLEFDLDAHLHRVDLGGAATTEDLLNEAQTWALKQLDPERPPWRGVFIEGLEGDRSAYFLVVHHCLMDGHGSVQLFSDLRARESRWDKDGRPPARTSNRQPSGWTVAADQVVRRAFRAPRLATRIAGAAAAAIQNPAQSVTFAQSVARVMTPAPASASPLLKGGSRTEWRYGTLDCSLADLKAAGKAVGGTINDAYVSTILGGLRIYHEEMGLRVGDVTINMPVSVRRDGDSKGGNKFAAAFFAAPSSIADPAERMRALRAIVSRVSGEPALDFFSLVLPVLNRAPSALLTPLFTGMQNRTDVTISNVPGMRTPAKILGAPVERIYYFGPLPGSPVMVVLYTLDEKAFIGINCDGEIFDVKRLVAAMERSLEEVLGVVESEGTP